MTKRCGYYILDSWRNICNNCYGKC
jgi:hypothetical protein